MFLYVCIYRLSSFFCMKTFSMSLFSTLSLYHFGAHQNHVRAGENNHLSVPKGPKS